MPARIGPTRLPNALAVRLTDRQRAAVELVAERHGISASAACRLLVEAGVAAMGRDLDRELEQAGHGVPEADAGTLLDLAAKYATTEQPDGSIAIDTTKKRRRSRS
jgi:hypothetical protein